MQMGTNLLLLRLLVLGLNAACVAGESRAADAPALVRKQDVVYGRKHGMALTLACSRPRSSPTGRP